MTETAVDAPAPTTTFYASLQRAFDHFNGWLFGGQLPPCLITLRPVAWAAGGVALTCGAGEQAMTPADLLESFPRSASA